MWNFAYLFISLEQTANTDKTAVRPNCASKPSLF